MMTFSEAPTRTLSPPLSTGEVNFLWWFIQGSLMNAPVREDLRRGWGPCERHTLAVLIIENALRPHYLHGPVILFHDLIKRAVAAYAYAWPLHDLRTRLALTPSRPCHFCALGIDAASRGDVPHDRFVHAGDETNLRNFMADTHDGWRSWVCPACTGRSGQGGMLCRRHLLDDGKAWDHREFASQREKLEGLADHLDRYERAFSVDYHGTDNAADHAALIAAAGWLGGWGQLWKFWTMASPVCCGVDAQREGRTGAVDGPLR